MDRYQRVEKPRPESSISENEIRITAQGKMRNYITYATALVQEKKATEIVLKAMGRAINKTVTIAEIIKRRIGGLHQITSIGSTNITDTWEPLEEGLLPLETTRHVSMITITLSAKDLDKTSVGYQAPLPADQIISKLDHEDDKESSPQIEGEVGSRGKGNISQAGTPKSATVHNGPNGWNGGRGRGRFQGKGRGFRGRGKGSRGEENEDAKKFEVAAESTGRGQGQRGRGKGRDNHPDGGENTSGEPGAA